MAFEVDRAAEESAWRENHRLAAGCRRGIDGFLDRRGVHGPAIATGTELPDVEVLRGEGLRSDENQRHGSNQSGRFLVDHEHEGVSRASFYGMIELDFSI